jgi:CHAT domain-containing protein/Tfp pilus assembly protein PilF
MASTLRRFALLVAYAALTVAVPTHTAGTSAIGQAQSGNISDRAEIDALIAQAERYQSQSDNPRSLEAWQQALAILQRGSDTAGQARAQSGIASAYGRLSDYQKSIDHHREALGLFRALGDRKGEASALSGIGTARVRLNQYDDARTVLNQSLAIYQAIGDRAGAAAALQGIGYATFSQDEYASAIDIYNQALALARADGSRGLEASIAYNLGQVYYHLGEYQTALDLYTDALAVHRTLGNRSGEAAALSALGRVYRFLGDHQKALDHHAQALVILRAVGERMNEATSLNNSGHVHLSMGEFDKALPFFEQSLDVSRAVGNQSGVASNTNGIGLVHAGLREYDTALGYHREALRLFRTIGHRRAEADSLGHIGRAYEGLGDWPRALSHLREALAIYRAVHVPRQESETLYAIARTEQAAGDLAAARSDIDQAIQLAEGFRQDVSSQQLRTSYQGTIRDFYELKIDVLLQLDGPRPSAEARAAALEASERARARTLLDLLGEARADIRGDVDPRLLERERTVRQRLAGRAERQAQLVGAGGTPAQLAAIAREIDADLGEYQNVLASLRISSPRYSALMRPEPLSAAEIQGVVLDADTLLLEYFLGRHRSYVWAVTHDAMTTHVLAGRDGIEAAARRFYDLLSAKKAGSDVDQAARTLSDLVLAPVAERLGRRRLAVVADGALHYVPFAALPEPGAATAGQRQQPLIIDHEIVSLPSASTLAVLRREAGHRAPASRLVAVLADPVFDADDVRVRRARTPSASREHDPAPAHATVRPPIETLGLSHGTSLPRLLGTRREARAILAAAPGGKSREALDFDASRETATNGSLSDYQVVHFATHALVNNQNPELSGLVLSLVDRGGRAQDGFLRLTDIYNLRLPAELVVLSACRTGLGKEMRGEGLIGLTRGFMYAGAPRLLASLWEVDDAATSDLMTRFYRALLGSSPMNAASALRDAQVAMWRQQPAASRYEWAAFGLHGEWQRVRTDVAAR